MRREQEERIIPLEPDDGLGFDAEGRVRRESGYGGWRSERRAIRANPRDASTRVIRVGEDRLPTRPAETGAEERLFSDGDVLPDKPELVIQVRDGHSLDRYVAARHQRQRGHQERLLREDGAHEAVP